MKVQHLRFPVKLAGVGLALLGILLTGSGVVITFALISSAERLYLGGVQIGAIGLVIFTLGAIVIQIFERREMKLLLVILLVCFAFVLWTIKPPFAPSFWGEVIWTTWTRLWPFGS